MSFLNITTNIFYLLLWTISLGNILFKFLLSQQIGVKSLPLLNKNTNSLFWKNNMYNFNQDQTYYFLYLRLLSKLTNNLFLQKNVCFLKFKPYFYKKLTFKKIRAHLLANIMKGKESFKKKSYLKLKKNKAFIGQVLLLGSNTNLVTVISLFSFKQNITKKNKKIKEIDRGLNFYKLIKVIDIRD